MATKKKEKTQSKDWTGKELVSNVVYVCDKSQNVQAFMYKPSKKLTKQYSVMTEFAIDENKRFIVYNNGIGPDLSLVNVREATPEIREKFFNAAHESNLAFDPKKNIWYTEEPEVTLSKYKTLYEPLESETKEKKSLFEEETIYTFITLNEKNDEYTEIIGEIDSKEGKIANLSAWAYISQPEVIRAPSQIIVQSQYPAPLTKLYQFSAARVSVMMTNEEDDSPVKLKDDYSNKTRQAIVRFINRIINDALKCRVYIVNWNKKYYVYPCYEECTQLHPAALCEITKLLNVVCPGKDADNADKVFGKGVIIDKTQYEQILIAAHERSEKKMTQILDDAMKKSEEKKAAEQQKQNSTTEYGTSTHASNILYTKADGKEFYTTYIFETTEEASNSIPADDSGDYIVINSKSDKTLFVSISDDVQAILHSRHLNRNGKTSVFGPIRDAENTFSYIIDYMTCNGWTTSESDSTLSGKDINGFMDDITDLQIKFAEKYHGYRLIQPSLNFFK
jgi:hypothetical protein